MYYKMDIATIFLDNPEKELHIRELARLLKISPMSASKYLKQLDKEGILESKEERNHILYKANTDNLKFKTKKLCYNLTKIINSGLLEFLEKEFSHPEAIVLFGSWRKAENNIESDLDILVISPKKKEIDLSNIEKIIRNKIQLFVYSKKELYDMKKSNPELLNNLANGIILEGFWEMF